MANFVSYENAEVLMDGIVQAMAGIVENLGGAYKFRGSIAFNNLPNTVRQSMLGFVYNITDQFTTDARFIEGAGKTYAAGTNVAVAELSNYVEVTPVGNENPSEEGWYVIRNHNFEPTTDETVQAGTTYYEYVVEYKYDVLGNFIDVNGIYTEIAKVAEMVCASFFDASNAYAIGDVVVHDFGLYQFTSAHTAGNPWATNEVRQIDVRDLISAAEPDSLTTAQVDALLAMLQ